MTVDPSIVHRERPPRRPGCLPGAHWWLTLLLAAVLLVPLPCHAASLPRTTPRPSSSLQEQAPPGAVQQLQAALDGRQPQVKILAPPDGTLLPAGEWDLRLQVSDWPLVDAGPLGLGPHLLVLIDDQPPLALTTTHLCLPGLTPGSHRVSVVAARPWGEAVKQTGAFDQVRIHRAAADPQGLPAGDAPELIAVAPMATETAEPILVDWLMPQAPLQNLRSDDIDWRLRLTLNGDSVLLDHQHPLWLSGWKRGSNAVVLEMLNAGGEPLNPPFTSQVLEVELDGSVPQPPWRRASLNPDELAQLLGEAPPPSAAPEPDQVPAPESLEPAAAAEPPSESPEALVANDGPEALREPSSEP